MAIVEFEHSIEERLDDEEFVARLVNDLLPQVKEALKVQKMKAERASSTATTDNFAIGGNIEHQQTSALKVIEDLWDKLLAIKNSEIDPSTIDYLCLERVLNFLIRRGENYQHKLAQLKELRNKYQIKR